MNKKQLLSRLMNLMVPRVWNTGMTMMYGVPRPRDEKPSPDKGPWVPGQPGIFPPIDTVDIPKPSQEISGIIDAIRKNKIVVDGSPWVDVNDRMPGLHVEVLVRDRNGKKFVTMLIGEVDYVWENEEVDVATHWMPIPECNLAPKVNP